MTNDNAYLMAFVAFDGGLYDVHPSDELMSVETIEYVWFKSTLPHSRYIFIWRRNKEKFTDTEAEELQKYVMWNLDEGTYKSLEEYEEREHDEDLIPVYGKNLDDNRCVVLGLDELELPDEDYEWDEFLAQIKISVAEMMEDKEWMLRHDKESKFYDGSFFKSKEFWNIDPE